MVHHVIWKSILTENNVTYLYPLIVVYTEPRLSINFIALIQSELFSKTHIKVPVTIFNFKAVFIFLLLKFSACYALCPMTTKIKNIRPLVLIR